VKLYSVYDLTKVIQHTAKELGFDVVSSRRGDVLIRQTSGRLSQNFRIKVEDATPEGK
jgi:hypothetical protein